MSRLVHLWKAEESAEAITYDYGASRLESGRLRLSKADKIVACLTPVPNVPEKEERFFYRDLAAAKLQMLATKGEFPDETYIAT